MILTWYVSNGRGGAASLQQEHSVTGLGQPPGQGGASRAGAHNDVVMGGGRGRGQDRGQPGQAQAGQVRQPEQEGQGEQGHHQEDVGQAKHAGITWHLTRSLNKEWIQFLFTITWIIKILSCQLLLIPLLHLKRYDLLLQLNFLFLCFQLLYFQGSLWT